MLKRMSENESPKKDEEAGGRMTHPASSEKFMGEIARSVETLEKEFDVDLSSLPESLVNEIVLSFQKEEPEHLERIKHFVDSGGDGQSGFYRLLTFFTLPAEFREDLLSVVSRIAPQNLGFVFEKYVGLQLSFSEIKNYLKGISNSEAVTVEELTEKVRSNYLRRVHEQIFRKQGGLIAEYGRIPLEDGSNLSHVAGMLHRELERIDSQRLVLLASLKILHDEGASVNLKEILDVDVRAAAPGELSAEEISEMRAIYAKNYENTPELQRMLLEKFDECVRPGADNKNIFYVLRHRDPSDGEFHVRSFFRLEDIGAPTHYREYFGAFNVDPEYRGSAVGDLMMEQYLDWRVNDGATIEADCDIRSPVTANYISRGFFGVGTGKFGEADTLHLIAADESWEFFELASGEAPVTRARIGEIIEEESTWTPGGRVVIAAEPLSRIDKIPFQLLDQVGGPMRFVLTRFTRKPSAELGEDVVYAVFESIPSEDLEMLIEGNELVDENDARFSTAWPGHDESTTPQTAAPELPPPFPVEELRKAA